jgi:class I lanthipeptide synthase
MKNKSLLRQKLAEISAIIKKKYIDIPDIGVLAGISGVTLFQFYYSKYLNIDEHANVGTEMILCCIEKINNGYSLPTFCNGIAGFGWAIQHLKTEDFIDVDCDDLLSPFDEYLYGQMKLDLDNGDYDFLHGALGYAFYFLSRYGVTEDLDLKKRYHSYLSEFINVLEALAISDGAALKWESILDFKKGNKGFNLSLSHGISSILNFVSRLHRYDAFRESTDKLIRGSANYIMGFKNNDPKNLSLFPSWVEKGVALKYNSRIAWCYGDLGAGLSLMNAGKSLNDIPIQQYALEVLNHTANRKAVNETLVSDAGICHGSYGNAIIYQRIFQESNHESFKAMFDFWIADGIQKAIFKDGYAGYKQWNGVEQSWTPELSLLEGVAGIGLVIIDYLSEKPNSWDECLLIS